MFWVEKTTKSAFNVTRLDAPKDWTQFGKSPRMEFQGMVVLEWPLLLSCEPATGVCVSTGVHYATSKRRYKYKTH